jgi:hypothetical protein
MAAATILHLLEPTDYTPIDKEHYARFITQNTSLFSFASHVCIHEISCEITDDDLLRSTPVASRIAKTGHRIHNVGS